MGAGGGRWEQGLKGGAGVCSPQAETEGGASHRLEPPCRGEEGGRGAPPSRNLRETDTEDQKQQFRRRNNIRGGSDERTA